MTISGTPSYATPRRCLRSSAAGLMTMTTIPWRRTRRSGCAARGNIVHAPVPLPQDRRSIEPPLSEYPPKLGIEPTRASS